MANKRGNRSRRCLKNFLSFCNVIFWFTGLASLGLGIWLYLILQDLWAALDYAQYVLPAYLLIISGGAVVIFGVTGCLAIFTESRCLLLFHCFCVMLICGADVFACVKSFMLNKEIESHIQYRLGINVDYKYLYDEGITKQIDTMQQKGCLHQILDAMGLLLSIVGWSTLGYSSYLIIYGFTLCCFRVSVPP
ncbi:Tetraspanin 7 [Mactra antiquata]